MIIIIIIIIIITNTKKIVCRKMQPEKKLFAQTTTQKKIVCLEKIFIPPPLQKNNGPSLKATSDSGSCQTRQKKRGDTEIPALQQYRILCDAFRPNVTSEQALYQKRYPSGYKRPKFATATELEYYVNVVSETNNSSLHSSS